MWTSTWWFRWKTKEVFASTQKTPLTFGIHRKLEGIQAHTVCCIATAECYGKTQSTAIAQQKRLNLVERETSHHFLCSCELWFMTETQAVQNLHPIWNCQQFSHDGNLYAFTESNYVFIHIYKMYLLKYNAFSQYSLFFLVCAAVASQISSIC